jgi:hypothetical protein
VHDAAGFPSGRDYLYDHPPLTLRAVAWRFQFSRSFAGSVFAAVERVAAAITVGVGHMFFASALIGIFSSFSMARSASAGRPKVVR